MKIAAYSEFMPAPRITRERLAVNEYEEAFELRPGLQKIGAQLVDALSKLGRGLRAQGIDGKKLDGNPCWPDELRDRGAPANEKYVVMLPLALSRTQDDKGRVRWTLFGAGERFPRAPKDLAQRIYGRKAKCLVTFTPFAHLPRRTRDAYLAGDLHLLPFPGSLLFFHAPGYEKLAKAGLPYAAQIPLLYSIDRSEHPHGIRVPQSGWIRETDDDTPHGPVRQTIKRPNRWSRIHRYEDEIPVLKLEQEVSQSLFSTELEHLGLYGKPMARNVQMWTDEYDPLLHGPTATRKEIARVARDVDDGGVFGYRFFYPPMTLGGRDVFWHRPLIASVDGVEDDAPLGFFTIGKQEVKPQLLQRDVHADLVQRFSERPRTLSSARKVVDAYELLGDKPLDASFARALIGTGRRVEETLEPLIRERKRKPESLTFDHTAKRSFESRYWRTIASILKGNNADPPRNLRRLSDRLLRYYDRLGIETESDDFEWDTDFEFELWPGWEDGRARNIIAKIPGRDRSRAVIMADHYDTAYMEDVFGRSGHGPREAAEGADDNHSATAALMLAAPVLRELDLACDVWLVHLTGEEFPADCLGARHLAQRVIEEKLRIDAVFVLDMIAHNNRHARDIFQICPGTGKRSMELARVAHFANVDWNESVDEWNARSHRTRRGVRTRDPRVVPPLAKHLRLHGDVRPQSDAHSTLYNTDGQIFSDAGIPVVLFMENYDINRRGYHDSRDTMANIDLDYGAALTSIAIETVARAATSRRRR